MIVYRYDKVFSTLFLYIPAFYFSSSAGQSALPSHILNGFIHIIYSLYIWSRVLSSNKICHHFSSSSFLNERHSGHARCTHEIFRGSSSWPRVPHRFSFFSPFWDILCTHKKDIHLCTTSQGNLEKKISYLYDWEIFEYRILSSLFSWKNIDILIGIFFLNEILFYMLYHACIYIFNYQ